MHHLHVAAADRLAARLVEDLPVNARRVETAGVSTIGAANRTLLRQAGTTEVPDDELRRITAPVALIWGRHDRIAPLTHAERAHDTFGWPLNVVDDAGHIAFIEQPDAFAAALRAALDLTNEPPKQRKNSMTINRKLTTALTGAAIAAAMTPLVAMAAPSTTEPPVPPIAVEELTRIDEETLVRGDVTDNVTAAFTIAHGGMDEVVIDVADLSHVAVARFTVQPGAQFPWHSHPGSVLVTVTHGELVYVMADDCSEHSYPAGTAFVDPGHGTVHSAYNPTDGETVIVATFLEMTADGPLSITEGITAPADNCGLPTA